MRSCYVRSYGFVLPRFINAHFSRMYFLSEEPRQYACMCVHAHAHTHTAYTCEVSTSLDRGGMSTRGSMNRTRRRRGTGPRPRRHSSGSAEIRDAAARSRLTIAQNDPSSLSVYPLSHFLSLPPAACTARASFPAAGPPRRVAAGRRFAAPGGRDRAKIKPRAAAPRKVLRLLLA